MKKKENSLIFIVMGILAIGFLVSLFFLRGTLKEKGNVKGETKILEEEITRLSETMISTEKINYLKDKSLSLKNDYEKRILPVLNSTALALPVIDEEQKRGAFYICSEQTTKADADCRQECKGKLQLPVSLGLDEYKESKGQPPSWWVEETPTALKKIELLNEIIKLLLDANIVNLLKIEFFMPGIVNTISGDTATSYKDFPLRVIAEGSISSLTKFLYGIRTSQFAFRVKSIKISPGERWKSEDISIEERLPVENSVVADIQISTLVLVKSE